MKEIQIDELRELQMQILDYVDAFCRKHDIKYTLSGGSLLGAVRHGGFIPWDDDMDIQMLRSEYNRFTELWNKEKQLHGYFELVNIESGNNMGYPIGKVHDTRTITFVAGVARTGVFIDVFPVDNVKDMDDFSLRHGQIRKLYKKQSRVFALQRNDFRKRSIWKRAYIFFIHSRKSREQLAIDINNLAQQYRDWTCPFVYEMIAGAKCKSPMPVEIFHKYADIRFEQRRYMSVADTDAYLTSTFGNYMQLPPLEKQVRTHEFESFWR